MSPRVQTVDDGSVRVRGKRRFHIYRDEMQGASGAVVLRQICTVGNMSDEVYVMWWDSDGSPHKAAVSLLDHVPATVLDPGEAQALADDLWRAGVRPAEAAGSAGQLTAVERHLADLRSYTDRLLAHVLRKGAP